VIDSKFIIALDVGGSSVKSGIVDLISRNITDFRTTKMNSSASADVIFTTLTDIIQHHQRRTQQIVGVGLGFPGPCDYETGIIQIEGVEKFDAIYGLNIFDELHARLPGLSVPIRWRNDAEAAIVGEGVYGVGRTYSRIIGLTLGTGCGSAFLIDGVPQTQGKGVPDNGWVYQIVYKGEEVDDVFSIRGLLKRLASASLDVDSVFDAIQQAESSPQIRAVLEAFGDDLAQFLKPLATEFGADAVILQGGISHGFPYFSDNMQPHLSIPALAGELEQDAALLGIANLFT
jgi:glucokinase